MFLLLCSYASLYHPPGWTQRNKTQGGDEHTLKCRESCHYLVPVPLVTSERAATHNFVCHRDPLRKVQLAEVINQGISSLFYG